MSATFTATPVDRLGAHLDELQTRLLDGRISTTRFQAAYRWHVARVTGLGFTANEAACTFWDAVSTARHTLAQADERSAAA
jgi:predicted RNA-binding protein associated with RNAse of E/G family